VQDTREEMNLLLFFKEVNVTAVAGWPVVKVDTAFHFPPFRFQILTCITHRDEIWKGERHEQINTVLSREAVANTSPSIAHPQSQMMRA
jgi:hypothetical protein